MKFTDFLVSPEESVMQAMRRLDKDGRGLILYVTAADGRLLGVVTNGDIRRYILAGGSLEAPVLSAANTRPYTLHESQRWEAQDFLRRHAIEAVPLLDDRGVVVDAVVAEHLSGEVCGQIGLPVVMMAGGLGTRLYPYTKILPKPLIPIGEKPIAEHIMDNFSRFGCREFCLVVNYRRNMIKSYFADVDKEYTVTYQDEDKPLGTGGGLALLKGKLNGTFILTNCDIMVKADYADIYRYHKEHNNKITMVCAFQHTTIPYGVVELAPDGRIAKLTEKPQMSYLTNTGVYLVEPEVVEAMEDDVAIGFPEVIDQWRAKDNNNLGVYPVNESCWMDMGQLETLDDMRRRMENAK